MKSYRFTNQKSVMSDWGHAMFADDADTVSGYGKKIYSVNHSDLVDFDEVAPLIKQAIEEDIESEEAYNRFEEHEISDVDAFIECFNPRDIVDAAEAYDNAAWCNWLSERVCEPNNIWAIKTYNGAIVLDEELISRDLEMEKTYFGENV